MTDNYDHDALVELCNQIDLLEYASESVDFERRGSDSYAAHCPLHVDKTPSLMITPSKNLFYCHSCHVGGSILNWMMKFENLTFRQAVEKISVLTNTDINKLKQCDAMKFFKEMKNIIQQHIGDVQADRKILDAFKINEFSSEIPQEWIEEGIDAEVMKKFNIRIDPMRNRIIYPVYDKDFHLIGFKGRTRYENYKTLGIQKYMNYTKVGTTDYFAGMKENIENIKAKNKIIIFEGIKSVMKAYGWGYDYAVAAETSHINDAQVKILIQMGIKDVTIGFDSDVTIKQVAESTQMLKKFTNVYVMKDRKKIKDRLLGNKESPVDRGKEIFEILLHERRKI